MNNPRILTIFATCCIGFAVSLAAPASPTPASQMAPPGLPAPLRGFLEQHCVDCHDADAKKGGLDLTALPFEGSVAADAKWVRAFDLVSAGEMPPKKKPRPDAAAQRAFLGDLGKGLTAHHAAVRGTVLRRLNRTEYENTLRDLLGVSVDVRAMLPEDAISHGFDNVGDALGMSDVQLAQYLEAAKLSLDELFSRTARPQTTSGAWSVRDPKKVTPAGPLAKGQGENSILVRPDGMVVAFGNGRFPTFSPARFDGDGKGNDFRATAEGSYRIRVSGHAYQSDQPVVFAVRHGQYRVLGDMGDIVGFGEFSAKPGFWEATVQLRAGDRFRLFPEVNPDYPALQKLGPSGYTGAGLAISGIEIEGPIVGEWPPRGLKLLAGDLPSSAKVSGDRRKAHLELSSARPEADAAKLLQAFASAAFRRPVSPAKVAPYVALFRTVSAQGADFTSALKAAAAGILCSPDFLYLIEPAGPLDDYALASRLSYFLRRSMPDDDLMRAAAAGQLRTAPGLRSQTERLLGHPNAARFHADFTDAWLNLRDIEFTTPDAKLYPEFDEALKDSMLRETRGYFRELLASNLGPSYLVSGDFAMLNSRLARHYGLPAVAGMEVRRVPLPPGSHRGGFLTQAGVLKVSANGTTTSPVVRGAYVLDRILGTPPQPPPPGIPGVEPDTRGAKTLRQILDKHRNMESCNGCHRVIDPPGFALENYDVIGGWRERFRSAGEGAVVDAKVNGRKVNYRQGPPVDATGQLPNGTTFRGFDDFQKLLVADAPRLSRCIAEKLLTFATGREMGFSDRPEIERISGAVVAERKGMRDLLHALIQSEIFRNK